MKTDVSVTIKRSYSEGSLPSKASDFISASEKRETSGRNVRGLSISYLEKAPLRNRMDSGVNKSILPILTAIGYLGYSWDNSGKVSESK